MHLKSTSSTSIAITIAINNNDVSVCAQGTKFKIMRMVNDDNNEFIMSISILIRKGEEKVMS